MKSILFGLALVFVGTNLGRAAESTEESLQFRHEKPATVHFLNRQLAEDYQRRLRSVGCNASLSWHWGHTDLTYQCTEWRALQCRDHAEATEWLKFFSILCFEASHAH